MPVLSKGFYQTIQPTWQGTKLELMIGLLWRLTLVPMSFSLVLLQPTFIMAHLKSFWKGPSPLLCIVFLALVTMANTGNFSRVSSISLLCRPHKDTIQETERIQTKGRNLEMKLMLQPQTRSILELATKQTWPRDRIVEAGLLLDPVTEGIFQKNRFF